MATFDAVTWPVRTERLVLRPAQESDIASLWPIRRREDVARWLSTLPTSYEQHLAKHRDPVRLQRTLVAELDDRIIGDLMVAPGDAWTQTEVAERAEGVQAELGWCFDPDFGGRGYATEAVDAVIRICFEDLGLRRVTAACFADNEPSWRLMERVGMRREVHTRQDSLHRSGGWLDGLGYALLADDWRERQRLAEESSAPTVEGGA